MASKRYRFALIGYGGRAREHALWLKQLKHQCVAICDTKLPNDDEKNQLGGRFYHDYRDLLKQEDGLDFVVIASQEVQHVPQALASLKRGIPVYLEKAVSNTWRGAVKLYRETIEHQYPLFIGYNLRRFQACHATKRLLDRGAIGTVQSVLGHCNAGTGWGSNVMLRKYYADAALSGDIVVTKLTHDTDWIQHALSTRVVDCTATAERNTWTGRPVNDVSAGYLERDNSILNLTSHDVCCCTGNLDCGAVYTVLFTTTGPDYERRFVFSGSSGQITCIAHTSRPGAERASVELWPLNGKPRKIKLPNAGGGHGGADPATRREFLRWLRAGHQEPSDPESILLGMIIPTAALESARTGRRIDCARRLQSARRF
jgi:predicted dehydrogenase